MHRHHTHYAQNQGLDVSNSLSDNAQMLNVRERRAAQARNELRSLIEDFGLNRAAEAIDVYPSTIERWLAGTTRVPRAALIALRAIVWSRLPGMEHPDWRDVRIGVDGRLHEGGMSWSLGEIRSLYWREQQVKSLEDKIAALQAQIERLSRPAAVPPAANDATA